VVLGPSGAAFGSYQQIREWTMTSPTGVPLTLDIVRPSGSGEDLRFEARVQLAPYPLELPEIPGPPQVGELAPALPSGLRSVGPEELASIAGREHILLFWATWCGPCKAAVPELLAFEAARGIPVLAISDEGPEVVRRFLADRKEPFLRHVAVDPLRRVFLSYGVNGTPSILLVDATGRVRVRQVGYDVEKGLAVRGWSWSPPSGP
jgi:thiol-disulfide isomerase/thioredoxin